jgi:hypothetical protein
MHFSTMGACPQAMSSTLRQDCCTAAAYWHSCKLPVVGLTPAQAAAPLLDWAAHAEMDALDIPQEAPSHAQPWEFDRLAHAALVVSY